MHVGLDVRMWHHTGIGRYIRALVRHLPGHGVSLTVWGPPAILAEPALDGCARRECDLPVHSLAEQATLPRDIARSGVELFHSPHLNLPLLGDFQRVVTIHDLIPLHHPETLSWAGRQYFRAMATVLAPRKANRVLTVSEWTRADLIAHGVSPEHVVAVPLGVEPAFAAPLPDATLWRHLDTLGVRPPFILYAGQQKAYKNLAILVDAFADLLARHDGTRPRPSLVLLGRPDARSGLTEWIEGKGLGDAIVCPGYLADEEAVVALFQAARCFAFPSLCEGFGLPPLEAMAAGTPVVCSDRTPLAETAGRAAFLVDPHDVLEWSRALEQALWQEERRSQAIRAGRLRAAQFSWDRTISATIDVYREALVRV
ncbi:MAG: glycosyltransferase family 4 protein [Candidatus Sericytochromatia bacterium]|nr:glycosyltransferase family 4 protein [Candidatus Tanganyikabacteria bacterium]